MAKKNESYEERLARLRNSVSSNSSDESSKYDSIRKRAAETYAAGKAREKQLGTARYEFNKKSTDLAAGKINKDSKTYKDAVEKGKKIEENQQLRNDALKMAANFVASNVLKLPTNTGKTIANKVASTIETQKKDTKAGMTKEQREMYQYYLGTDKKKADEYLRSIADEANQRRGAEIANEMQGKTGRELLYGAESGLENFISGVEGTVDAIRGKQRATSAAQYASQGVREDLADNGKTIGIGVGDDRLEASLAQIGYDVINTSANQLPSLLVGAGAGTAAGLATMGLGVYGNDLQQKKAEGMTDIEATEHAIVNTVNELGLEYALGGFSKLGGKLPKALASEAISLVNKYLPKGVAKFLVNGGMKWISSIGGETVEEFLQDVFDPIYTNIIYKLNGDDAKAIEKIDWAEAIYSGLLGGLSAGMMEGPVNVANTAAEYTNTKNYGKMVSSAGGTEALVNEGLSSNVNTEAYELAQDIAARQEAGKKVSDFELGQLAQANESAIANEEVAAQSIDNAVKEQKIKGKISKDTVELIATNESAIEEINTELKDNNVNIEIPVNADEKTTRAAVQQAVSALSNFRDVSETQEAASNIEASTVDAETETAPESVTENSKPMMSAPFANEQEAAKAQIKDELSDIFKNPTMLNAVVDAWNGEPVSDFVLGAKEAYSYGANNTDLTPQTITPAMAAISPAAIKGIYNIAKVSANQEANINEGKLAGTVRSGDVIFDNHVNRENITAPQMSNINIVANVAKLLKRNGKGVDVVFYESNMVDGQRIAKVNIKGVEQTVEVTANGFYNDGVVYLDINAGNFGEGTILYTFAHELTHYIKQWSPKSFKKLATFLNEAYSENGESINERIKKQQLKAKAHGRELSYEAAYEEVVADSMQSMFTDTNAIEKLNQLKQQDRNLWQKFMDAIQQLFEDVKALYSQYAPNSEEGKLVRSFGDKLEKLSDYYVEALNQASENMAKAKDKKAAAKSNENVETKESSRYNEFNSLAMQWAYAPDRKVGDRKVLFRGNMAVAIMATEDGYIETYSNKSYEKVRDFNESYEKPDGTVYERIGRFEAAAGTDIWNNVSSTNGTSSFENTSDIEGEGAKDISTRNNKYLSGDNTKFSLRENVESTKELIAIHNLSEENLLKQLELGGLPMPSIAIAKASGGFNKFGKISLVFDKKTIDPARSNNEVYDRDAWTPTVPTVDIKINDDALDTLVERLKADFKKAGIPESYGKFATKFDKDYLADKFKFSEVGELNGSIPAYIAFLVEKGYDVPTQTEYTAEERYKDGHSVDPIFDYVSDTIGVRSKNEALKNEFSEWVKDITKDLVEKKGIRNNVDTFTPSGSRRSWESLHYLYNLENIVRSMKQQNSMGSGLFGSDIFGSSAQTFESIQDIKDNSNRLQVMDQQEYMSYAKPLADRFYELAGSLPTSSSMYAIDDAVNVLCEAVQKFNTKSAMDNYIKKELDGWAKYNDYIVDDLMSIVDDIRALPISYFEAKPRRVVGLSEVAVAVIPDSASEKLKNRLRNTNVNYVEYKSGDEESRKEVLNSLEDVKFSDRDYAPVFHSKISDVLAGVKQDKLGANSVVNMLKGKGIKDEEIKWSGIVPFLEGKKSVTKQELDDFVKENQLQIEVQKGTGIEDYDFFESSDDELIVSRNDNPYEYETWHYDEDEDYWYSSDTGETFKDKYDIRDWYESNNPYPNTKWSDYKLDGGENYREYLFKLPDSDYSNQAMRTHWDENTGVVAHARVQDFVTSSGKNMLFIEEIQSDWHNAGQKNGYESDFSADALKKKYDEYTEKRAELVKLNNEKLKVAQKKVDEAWKKFESFAIERKFVSLSSLTDEEKAKFNELNNASALAIQNAREYGYQGFTPSNIENLDAEYADTIKEWKAFNNGVSERVPDAPFRTTYTDFVLKNLLRMAAEGDYDCIGWTTGKMQEERWSEDYAEGYRIEYDQDIPKFLNKYGKQWGAHVETDYLYKGNPYTDLDFLRGRIESSKKTIELNQKVLERGTDSDGKPLDDITRALFENEISDEQASINAWTDIIEGRGDAVPVIPITDSMRNAVLYEGQTMFSDRDSEGNELSLEQQKYFEGSAVRDDNGNLKVVYHGTQNGGFNTFRNRENGDVGIFFTDSPEVAASYSGVGGLRNGTVIDLLDGANNVGYIEIDDDGLFQVHVNGKESVFDYSLSDAKALAEELYGKPLDTSGAPTIPTVTPEQDIIGSQANYAVYLDIVNPYVIDANGQLWDDIGTWNEAQSAYESGYDGVIFKNIYDSGPAASEYVKSNVYVAFDSSQIKSINNKQPTDNEDIRYSDRYPDSIVTDKKTLDFLNNQETITVYRAMALIDGNLYPPMASKISSKEMSPSSELGKWEQAIERPELIKMENGKPKFVLRKDNGKTVPAAYNPYIHTSLSPLNDQFSEAYQRPNLVVVEGEVPVSELTSGYKAQYAKDAVGKVKWKSGPVGNKLAKIGKPREVILTRWFKPTRVVPDTEVASVVSGLIGDSGIDIPYNTVTPSLREALEGAGVKISYSDRDIAYHGGDLGKSTGDHFNHQSSGRDSGHFGFGTYFIGNKEYFNKSYLGERPVEAVDFSKYNLWRPTTEDEGHDVHSALRYVDGNFTEENLNRIFNNEEYVNPYESYTQRVEDVWNEVYDDVADMYDDWYEDKYDAIREELYDRADDRAKEEWRNIIYELGLDDNSYYDVDSVRPRDIENRIERYFNDIESNYNTQKYYVDKLLNTDSLGNRQRIRDALMKAAKYNDMAMAESYDNRVGWDSNATVFMKALGWEGVDVRGYETLDNSTYGSVIYDLKGEDLARKQEIGTAKYSDRDVDIQKANEALKEENKKLAEDNANLKELVKLQGKETHGKMLKQSSIETVAGRIMKSADATGNKAELAKLLAPVYQYIVNDEDVTMDGIRAEAKPAIDWIQNNIKKESAIPQEAQDILNYVKGYRVYVSPELRNEIAYAYGNYNDYRKSLMGRVILTSNPADASFDEFWYDLSNMYPETFDETISDKDQPQAFKDAIDNLKTPVEYEEDANFLASEIFSDIYDGYWDVASISTVADKYAKQMAQLKAAHNEKMQQVRDYHNEQYDKLKKEYQDKLDKARMNYEDKAEAQRKALQKKYKESKEAARDSRQRTEMRHKIQKRISEIDKLVLNETESKHVPDELKPMVAQIRDAINLSTQDTETRLKDKMEVIEKTTNPEKLEQLWKEYNNIALAGEREKARMEAIRDAYKKVLDNAETAYLYDEVLGNDLEETIELVGDTPLRNMSMEQLQSVYDLYTEVLHTIRERNKLFFAEQAENVATAAFNVKSELEGKSFKELPQKLRWIRNFKYNELKPVYFMEMLDSKTLLDRYSNLRKGEDIYAVDIKEAKQFFNETGSKHGRRSWDMEEEFTFKDKFTKGEFKLTLDEIMSIYAYSKRGEQALGHLLGGGIAYGKTKTVKKGKAKIEYELADKAAKGIDSDTLMQIINTLTEEQRSYVDEMQAYLSDVMGRKGNEVTMKLYGIKKFGEKNYFPLKVVDTYITKLNEAVGESKLKNSGFTKAVKRFASNPIVVEPFTQVWAQHTSEMSLYHSFVLPLEDFNRVWNYHQNANEELGYSPFSVREQIQTGFGDEANNYISTFLTDVNGGVQVAASAGGFDSFVNLFKKGAVFASASVTIQQPSAVARAMAYIDPRYFVNFESINLKEHENLWEECQKYAPVATLKDIGYFDTNIGRTAIDWMTNEQPEGITEKAKALFTDVNYRDEVLSKAPAMADELTWVSIWSAAKNMAEDEGYNGEELLQRAGDIFTNAITHSQVYDSVFSRSAMMRSRNALDKMATAFMAEPTTSFNMLFSAATNKNLTKAQKAKVATATYASFVLNAALVAVVYGARDDDDDQTYLEKYVEHLMDNLNPLTSSLNPLTLIPYVKDIISMIQGYDVERADMSVWSDLIDAFKNLDSTKKTTYQKVEGLAGAVGNLFGLPFKNISRDIRSIVNVANDIKSDNTTTAAGLSEAAIEGLGISVKDINNRKAGKAFDAYMDGDNGKGNQIYDELVQGNINKGMTSEEAKKEFQTAAREYFRPLYQKAYAEKDYATMSKIKAIVKHLGVYKNSDSTIKNWIE